MTPNLIYHELPNISNIYYKIDNIISINLDEN